MAYNSRECLSVLKGYVYRCEYKELVLEISAIARFFHATNNKEWIKIFEELYKEIDGLTHRRILYNVKEYLKDFIRDAIKTVKGEYGKRKLYNKARTTLERLVKPYLS